MRLGGRTARGAGWLWLCGILLSGLAVGCLNKEVKLPVETTERVYELHCVGCHGAKGEGAWGSNIQDLKTSVDEIARVIADGVGKMPGYKGHLTDAEMRELAEYVKKFARAEQPAPTKS